MLLKKIFPVLLILLSLILSGCATVVKELQTYPIGLSSETTTTKTIHIGMVQDSREENALKPLRKMGYDMYLTRYGNGLFYVEDPLMQTADEFVTAAVRTDFREAGFSLVNDNSKADYSLAVELIKMESYQQANMGRFLLGLGVVAGGTIIGSAGMVISIEEETYELAAFSGLIACLSPLGIFLFADDIVATFKISAVLTDNRTNSVILQKEYETNEKYTIKFLSARYYNPRYVLVRTMKMGIKQLVSEVTELGL